MDATVWNARETGASSAERRYASCKGVTNVAFLLGAHKEIKCHDMSWPLKHPPSSSSMLYSACGGNENEHKCTDKNIKKLLHACADVKNAGSPVPGYMIGSTQLIPW